MKGLAAMTAAAVMITALSGCCGCGQRDGQQDGTYGMIEEGQPAEPESVSGEPMILPAEQPGTLTQEAALINAPMGAPIDVYAYVPPELVEAVSAGVPFGVSAAEMQFEMVYAEVMSVMDMEEIGTRSTYQILK